MLERVYVHPNGRFLMTESERPFFWMADTAWEIFHRCTREEADMYFENRFRKGFNVVQAVALAEMDGLHTPNVYGERPLIEDDPTRPNDAYFQFIDEVIRMAAAHNIYVALLPTWGDKLMRLWEGAKGPEVFNEHNAYSYAEWLAQRYRDQSNVLWVLGGDRPVITETLDTRPIWRAMAAAIRQHIPRALITFHPRGGESSSLHLHNEPWLDMNMMQSGHGFGRDMPNWEMIEHDYALMPAKPVVDGEPNYEDHPVSPWPTWDPANGYYRDHDVRKAAYRSIFAGGCGVTYGHHSVWQMFTADRERVNYAEMYWQGALDRPGAAHMHHLHNLMESRPYFTRIPDQSILVGGAGEKADHARATRDSEGTYAMVYLPTTRAVTVNTMKLVGPRISAWWYDPRRGETVPIGVYEPGELTVIPPVGTPEEGPDWVLVLDGAVT